MHSLVSYSYNSWHEIAFSLPSRIFLAQRGVIWLGYHIHSAHWALVMAHSVGEPRNGDEKEHSSDSDDCVVHVYSRHWHRCGQNKQNANEKRECCTCDIHNPTISSQMEWSSFSQSIGPEDAAEYWHAIRQHHSDSST